MDRQAVISLLSIFILTLLTFSLKSVWAIDNSAVEQKHPVRFQIKDAEQSLPHEARCDVTVHKRTKGNWQEVWEKRVEIGKTLHSKLAAGKYRVRAELEDWIQRAHYTEPTKKFQVPRSAKIQIEMTKAPIHAMILQITDQNGHPISDIPIILEQNAPDYNGNGRLVNGGLTQKKQTNERGRVTFKFIGSKLPGRFTVKCPKRHINLSEFLYTVRARKRWQRSKPYVLEAERKKINGTLECRLRVGKEIMSMGKGLKTLLRADAYDQGSEGVLTLFETQRRGSGGPHYQVFIRDGKAQLCGLENREYLVVIETPAETGRRYLFPASERKTIRIEDGELAGPRNIVFSWPGANRVPVEFQVIAGPRGEGKPVPNARVKLGIARYSHIGMPFLKNRVKHTDKRGLVKTKLAPRKYHAKLYHQGYERKEIEFEVTENGSKGNIVLEKKPAYPVLRGYVRCEGNPVQDARVYAIVVDNSDGRARRKPISLGKTDKQGHYQGKLPRGTKKGQKILLRVTRNDFAQMHALTTNDTEKIRADINCAPQLNVKVQLAGEYSNLADEGGMLRIFPDDAGYMAGNYRVSAQGEATINPVPGIYEIYFISTKDAEPNTRMAPPVYVLGEYELYEGQENLTIRLDEQPESRPGNELQKELRARRDLAVRQTPENDPESYGWQAVILTLAGIIAAGLITYLLTVKGIKYGPSDGRK